MSTSTGPDPAPITVMTVDSSAPLPLAPRDGKFIIGIDVSLRSTGIVLWSKEGERYGVLIKSSGSLTDPIMKESARNKGISDAILSVASSADPIMALIESRMFVTEKDNSSERRAGVYWTVVNTLLSQGVPVVSASPKTIKKWVTTNGNASKEMMVSKARALFPDLSIPSDDIADSSGLASMGAHLMGWETPWKPKGVRRKFLEASADLSALDLSALP